jgi:hypothetical protein
VTDEEYDATSGKIEPRFGAAMNAPFRDPDLLAEIERLRDENKALLFSRSAKTKRQPETSDERALRVQFAWSSCVIALTLVTIPIASRDGVLAAVLCLPVAVAGFTIGWAITLFHRWMLRTEDGDL